VWSKRKTVNFLLQFCLGIINSPSELPSESGFTKGDYFSSFAMTHLSWDYRRCYCLQQQQQQQQQQRQEVEAKEETIIMKNCRSTTTTNNNSRMIKIMVVVVVAVLGTTHSSGVVEAAAFGGPFLHSKQQFGLPNSPEKTKIINNNNNNNYHEPRSSMPFGRQRQWQQRDPSINGIWKMSKNDDTTTTTTTTTNSVDVDAASQKNKEYERRARLSNKTKALLIPKNPLTR